MIHWKREGETIEQGLSFYHPKDKSSFGGCLRIGNRMWRARYSKIAKRWFIGYIKLDPATIQHFKDFMNKA